MNTRLIFILPLMLSLAGCQATKEQLGLTRHAPDEFAVLARAPLQMPPEQAGQPIVLPRPQPGIARPQEISPTVAAQAAVLGQPSSATASSASTAENVLLQRAGATQSDPNIRSVVNKEAVEDTNDNRPVVKRIMGIVQKGDAPATIVDAPGELERLKANKKSGKTVTQGDTPTLDD